MGAEYDIVIIGAGPGGLAAGLYSARAGMSTVILEKLGPEGSGGQALLTPAIENYPGFESTSGVELAEKMRAQAERFGARIESFEVTGIEKLPDGRFRVERGHEKDLLASPFTGLSVIIATGARPKKLGVPGEERLLGRGVSTCATCDGPFYKGKRVVVAGGGNKALEEARLLAGFADKVSIIHRRDRFRAEEALQRSLLSLGEEKVEPVMNSVVKVVLGDERVEGVVVQHVDTGEERRIPCEGFFVSIGMIPNTEFVQGFLKLDAGGGVLTDEAMRTSVEGVFAAGDCRKKTLNQVVTACADGATAAYSAARYVQVKKGEGYP